MIRLLIIAVALFLLWVVFLSEFSRERKIWVTIAAMVFSVLAMWAESNWQRPKANVVQASSIVDCGTSAKHSYRTSFDLVICLRNQAESGNVKRVSFDVVATQCDSDGDCTELERVSRELTIELNANSETTVRQNLQFKMVDAAAQNVTWGVEVTGVRATAR